MRMITCIYGLHGFQTGKRITIQASSEISIARSLREIIAKYFPATKRNDWDLMEKIIPAAVEQRIGLPQKSRPMTQREKELARRVYQFHW